MLSSTAKHYDKPYFMWQAPIGEFGGWANLTKFQRYVRPNHNVLDFGCGGGYLFKNMSCRDKFGIEVGEEPRQTAKGNGIAALESSAEIKDDWADLIVCNRALEHVTNPLAESQRSRPKLKPGGTIVFVVPCECEAFFFAYVKENL